MTDIRKSVDPKHILPNVELVVRNSYEWDHLVRDQMDIVYNGKQVGKCNIVSETDISAPFAHFDGIEIVEDMRGKGIGLAAYILAIEISHSRGLPFETQNWAQKPGAKKIWELLADRGVAEIIEPFTPSETFEGQFNGKFRVPVAP
jgi:hypothetical protein